MAKALKRPCNCPGIKSGKKCWILLLYYMSDIDLKLLETVNEDLTHLSAKWNQDIDDASLRIASPILRRLLIDGMLGGVAHILKKQIQIMAPSICEAEKFKNLRDLDFYQCGGAKYKGGIVQPVLIVKPVSQVNKKVLSPQEITKLYEASKHVAGKSYPVKISVFLKQTSFVIKGIAVNREEVIKYVANKLGGAHYDSKRKIGGDTSKITLEHKYALMDKVRDELMVLDKNAIYYELLSIGQRIINSRDVQKLRKELKHVLTDGPKAR